MDKDISHIIEVLVKYHDDKVLDRNCVNGSLYSWFSQSNEQLPSVYSLFFIVMLYIDYGISCCYKQL